MSGGSSTPFFCSRSRSWLARMSASLPAGSQVVFTFYWPQENRWEGTDYGVVVE